MSDIPFNHDQACASVEQAPVVKFYENYHQIRIYVNDSDDVGRMWDAYSWIRERLGDYEVGGVWSAGMHLNEGCMRFYIKDASEAILFKLTWL